MTVGVPSLNAATLTYTWRARTPLHHFEAKDGPQVVGSLTVDEQTRAVLSVRVDVPWRRRGVATALYTMARKRCPWVEAPTGATLDGKAWAASL